MYNRYERASRSRVTSPKVLLESKVTKKSIKSKNEEVDNKAPIDTIDMVESTNTSEVNVQELSPAPKKRRGRRKKSEVTEISPESEVNEGEV